MKTGNLFIALVACSFLLVHCGPDGRPDGLGDMQRAIINGTPEDGYPGVGALIVDQGGGLISLCTGASIAPGWVLTAAHCVADAKAEDLIFTTDKDISNPAAIFYRSRRLHPHPDYTPAGSAHQAENDIALVEVIGLDTVNYSYNTDSRLIQENLPILWVGYGLVRTSPPSGDGIKRSGTGKISTVSWFVYSYDYEGQQPCLGDSGGPAFAQVGGELLIVGVVSSADEFCREAGVDTRVDPYLDWIADTLTGGPKEPKPDADGGVPDAEVDGSPIPDAGLEESTTGDGTEPQDTTGPEHDQTGLSDGCSCSAGFFDSGANLILLAPFIILRSAIMRRYRRKN